MYTRAQIILNQKGWTISKLAETLGTTHQNASSMLKSDSLSLHSLERLAAALDVPAWLLLASEDDATRYLLSRQTKPTLPAFSCPACKHRFSVKPKISLNIAHAIADRRKSTKTVARLLGVSHKEFLKLLDSPLPPAAPILQQIANALHCELSDLFSVSDWDASPILEG